MSRGDSAINIVFINIGIITIAIIPAAAAVVAQ